MMYHLVGRSKNLPSSTSDQTQLANTINSNNINDIYRIRDFYIARIETEPCIVNAIKQAIEQQITGLVNENM